MKYIPQATFAAYMKDLAKVIAENSIAVATQDYEKGKISKKELDNAIENPQKTLEYLVKYKDKQYGFQNWQNEKHVFSLCLSGKDKTSDQKVNDIAIAEIIYPFGFNLSQKEATENALLHRLSVIEGPPGTGKTQSILNIVANCIMHEKTVGVVSNNNSAVDNVLEKLKKQDLDFLAAFIGNKARNTAFDASNTTYPLNIKDWKISDEELKVLKQRVKKTTLALSSHMAVQQRIAVITQDLKMIATEYNYYQQYRDAFQTYNNLGEIEPHALFRLKSEKLLELLVETQREADKDSFKYFSLLFKIKTLIKYGLVKFSAYNNPTDLILWVENSYYTHKIAELEQEKDKLIKQLVTENFDNILKENTNDAMRILKARLYQYYLQDRNIRADVNEPEYIARPKYCSDNLSNKNCKGQTESFLKEYPLIMSTTHSIRRIMPYKDVFLDWIIIDESSQVDISTGANSLSCAKNAVLVGDLKQLPPIITQEASDTADEFLKKRCLPNVFRYTKDNSILNCIISMYTDIPRVLLREHYRCAFPIINFCNQRFYNGELIIMTKESPCNNQNTMRALITVNNGYDAANRQNLHQVASVMEEVIEPTTAQNTTCDIGVITPYRNQVKAIEERIDALPQKQDIKVSTVHAFQGMENDLIIFCSVNAKIAPNDFVDEDNLINVAVSRAKKNFVLLAEGKGHSPASNIATLIDYIEYNNFEIKNSRIRSVFSFLHEQINGKFKQYTIKNQENFDSPAEEIFFEEVLQPLISSNIDGKNYNTLEVLEHYQLLKLVNINLEEIKRNLSEKHCLFVMRPGSHVDFLIKRKGFPSPILAIEINGQTHNEQERKENDMLKKKVLDFIGLPLLTLTTYDCEEKEKVIEALDRYYFNNSK